MIDRAHLNLRQRFVLRWLGVKISEDGLRWTASQRHQDLVEQAFEKAAAEFWIQGGLSNVVETSDGLFLDGPRGRMTLRWTP
jgi:hypothetical protein